MIYKSMLLSIFEYQIKTTNIMKTIPTLESNEFFRINSYYWQNMIYIALEVKEDKTLCQIKDSASKPKWIKTEQLSKEYKDFREV